MLQVKNSVPLIFLGAISGTFVLLSIYHFWFKRNQRNSARDEEESIEHNSQRQQSFDATELKAKKKTPRMWDVQIPRLGRPSAGPSPDEDDEDDELDEKDAGKWDTIKVSFLPFPSTNVSLKIIRFSSPCLSSTSRIVPQASPKTHRCRLCPLTEQANISHPQYRHPTHQYMHNIVPVTIKPQSKQSKFPS